jgi:hypothetical protein
MWNDAEEVLPSPEEQVIAIVDGYDGLLTLERRWEICYEHIEPYFKDFLYWDWVDNDGQDLEGRVRYWMYRSDLPEVSDV